MPFTLDSHRPFHLWTCFSFCSFHWGLPCLYFSVLAELCKAHYYDQPWQPNHSRPRFMSMSPALRFVHIALALVWKAARPSADRQANIHREVGHWMLNNWALRSTWFFGPYLCLALHVFVVKKMRARKERERQFEASKTPSLPATAQERCLGKEEREWGAVEKDSS